MYNTKNACTAIGWASEVHINLFASTLLKLCIHVCLMWFTCIVYVFMYTCMCSWSCSDYVVRMCITRTIQCMCVCIYTLMYSGTLWITGPVSFVHYRDLFCYREVYNWDTKARPLFEGYFYCVLRLFLLCPLFRGYFYCVHYSEVISIASIIQRLFLLRPLFRGYFYCVHYSEVISIVSIIQRLFLLRPLFRGYFYCVHYSEVIPIFTVSFHSVLCCMYVTVLN